MKKVINSIILSIIFLFMANTSVNAENEMKTLKLKEINGKDIEIYILLPKEYIEFAISKDGANVQYQGVQTLVNYEIPSIKVQSGKVHRDVYKENDTEYVQILLNKNEEGYYSFDVLKEYEKMNIKYRAFVSDTDYIVNIDSFNFNNNLCEIEYDSEKNIAKQLNANVLSTQTLAIIIVAIMLFVIIWGSSSKGGK